MNDRSRRILRRAIQALLVLLILALLAAIWMPVIVGPHASPQR